jgi:hypothetical protein
MCLKYRLVGGILFGYERPAEETRRASSCLLGGSPSGGLQGKCAFQLVEPESQVNAVRVHQAQQLVELVPGYASVDLDVLADEVVISAGPQNQLFEIWAVGGPVVQDLVALEVEVDQGAQVGRKLTFQVYPPMHTAWQANACQYSNIITYLQRSQSAVHWYR